MEAESDLPEASLFTPPITVASPMSCMAIEVGMPPLDLSSFSSLENALHSGPVSTIFSLTTNPQLLQTSSPPRCPLPSDPSRTWGTCPAPSATSSALEKSLSVGQRNAPKRINRTSRSSDIFNIYALWSVKYLIVPIARIQLADARAFSPSRNCRPARWRTAASNFYIKSRLRIS